MVSNNPMTYLMHTICCLVAKICRRGNDMLHQISIVIVMFALKQRADTLQPHPRINRRLGKIGTRTVCMLLKLHEDKIPNFYKSVPIFIGATGWPTGYFWSVIEKYFRTRSTWSRIPHRPKIVRCSDGNNPIIT